MRCTMAMPVRPFSLFLRSCGLTVAAFTAFLCSSSAATAQDKPAQRPPAAATATPQTPDLSKEALAWEKLSIRIREEADGTGTRKTTARMRILADAGVKQMAVLTFTYTASNQQVEIGYVRVIKPDGSVVVTPDYNVQDMPADVTRQAPMYSDIHQKHVAVKGLGVGDTLEYEITLRTVKAEVPGHFWLEYSFEKNFIVLDEQLDLDLPADKAVTVASADLQPAISSASGRKLYHWASSNLARPDPDAPPKSVKHLKPSVQVTTFGSWEQIGAWYDTLQRQSVVVTPAIQAKADALAKGLASNEDKVRAIFNDVALHIHYVGLEFGIGRYQPHPADDVLSNEYGDCKDKHTLLASLLKAVGIESWPVLISSERELDPATPSPGQFNHVITLVPLNGKLVWMDSTEEVAPVGVLMMPLRDKQALAVPIGKPAYLERTPAELPFTQSARFQTDGKLSDQGVFTGHIAQSYHGDVELILRAVMRQVPQSQLKEAMQGFSQGIGFGGEVSNPQISEIEQTGQPLQFSYDYTREKYDQWDEHVTSHWISPPLPAMGGELAPGVKEKKPGDEPELGSTGGNVYHATIQLPAGWTMTPPKDVDLKEDWLEYHAKYSFKDGTFTAERTLTIKKTKMPLEDWDKYLAFRRSMFEDWNRQTLISQPNLATAQDWENRLAVENLPRLLQEGVAGVFSEDMKEQLVADMQLMRDATAILKAYPQASPEDLAKATDLSRKAVEAAEAKSLTLAEDDPHSLYWAQILCYAWGTRGWSALVAKDLPTSESYLRAAWQLGQDKLIGYHLGQLLEAKGEKAAAAHQYELASVSSAGGALGGGMYSGYDIHDQIAASYQKLTGKPLAATALSHGQYNGSLSAELDKEIEIHGFTRTSTLHGDAMFTVSYEADKPVKSCLLHGEKGFAPMGATLQGSRFGVVFPAGSKARLLREVRMVCSSYGGGCDAYMLRPTAVQIPPKDITPGNAPKGTKTFQIEVQHQ